MPLISLSSRWHVGLDNALRAKVTTFLQKLSENDSTSGLHVEPIANSVDSRVRTGRVDQFWRAVMFRLDGGDEPHYVVRGVWAHDDAIDVARRSRLKVNPVNGVVTIREEEPASSEPAPIDWPEPPVAETPAEDDEDRSAPPVDSSPAVSEAPSEPLLTSYGYRLDELVDRLGLPQDVAARAVEATSEDELLTLAADEEVWVGNILVELGAKEPIDKILEKLQLGRPLTSGDEDKDIRAALERPASKADFAFIGDQDELKRVIESGDFGAWRVFLHPEQRKYVERSWHGPFRLSGGAGTGKTVVVLHRARELWRRNPQARIVMTTYTTNLAESMRESLRELDPKVVQTSKLGEPGVYVIGIDALAAAVLRGAGPRLSASMQSVLGEVRTNTNRRTAGERWNSILDGANSPLPAAAANADFLSSEYELVVLPNRVVSEADYLRVRRPGRGVALDRAKRLDVWALLDSYRASSRVDGTLDFAESAAVAAAYLDDDPDSRLADHVLVDEGQDLLPTHWQLVRALVASGDDDLFIAEDSHQRIYGSKIVLGRYGIKIVGRSQRLTLNYRTTAQNLHYAMTILEGGDYVDLEDEAEETRYRSARSGPAPKIQRLTSLSDELTAIGDRVRGWLDTGDSPATIAVLVHDRYSRDRIVNRLSELDIPARAIDRDSPQTDRVQVMTMHRAKGMEFSKVILADIGYRSPAETARVDQLDPADRRDAELRARSLVYVAATRARDVLVVLQRSA